MTSKQRFPYFKFYAQDWIEATRHMTLEERGAYIDVICFIMQAEGRLPDNDTRMAYQMHISARKWRSVKAKLVDHQKINVSDGLIINERCLRELDALLTQRQNVSEAATSRERTKRESAPNQTRVSAEKTQKPNEINETNTTAVDIARVRAVAKDLDSDLENRKKDTTTPSQQEAKSVVVGEEISGLNGATVLMVETLAGWIRPGNPDRRTAREWLGGTVKIYGSEITKSGFAVMQSKFASGDIISRPLPTMTGICQNLQAKAQAKAAAQPKSEEPVRPAHVPPEVWEITMRQKRERDAARQREAAHAHG